MRDERPEVEELLRELPRPQARGIFRERLAQEFQAGFAPAPEGASAAQGRGPLRLVAPAVLAAAAALLLWTFLSDDSPADWEAGTAQRFQATLVAMRAGETVAAGAEDLDLALPSGLEVRLRAGGQLAFLDEPQADAGQVTGLRLVEGELLVRGPEDYAGPQVLVVTPEIGVLLGGSGMSILASEMGTCVCVAHGQARLLARSATAEPPRHDEVRGGHTHFEFADRRPPHRAPFSQPGGVHADAEAEARHLAPLMDYVAIASD